MPGPVERWLETFMCSQYAKLFDDYGFKTLQSVCQLQMSHLQSMGIHPTHRSIIYQNVEVIRQSIQGPLPYGEENYFRNRMPQDMPSSAYESRDHQQLNSMNLNYNQHMNMHGGYGNQRPMMQQFPGSGPYSQNQQTPQQQHFPMSGFKQDYPNTMFPSRSRAANEMESNNSYPRQPNPFAQAPGGSGGGPGANQSNIHHSHLTRNSQNPQEVANNILHMATSSYPQYNTVQVPLSKGRSAPYHVPHRSGHYGMMSPNDSQLQQYQQIQQMQFTYPTSSPQMHPSPHSAMSPVSPASATVMSSPHSIHSGHSVPCSSPASIHSPRMSCVRSPGSDISTGMMRTPEGGVANLMNQQMSSPQRSQQYPMSSPAGAHHNRMVSPVPVHQQLQVSTSSSVANQFHQNYRDLSNMVSPSGSTTKSHYSSCSNIQPSPGAQSVHHSNMSSPYTPGSHASPGSPNQQHFSNPLYVMDSSTQADKNHQTSGTNQGNPLQSLQKLCMLPESRVVDPKSVVNDTCAPSPHNLECSRPPNSQNDYQQSSTSGFQNNNGDVTNRTYGMNPHVNDRVADQPVQTSDNCVGSDNHSLSNETPVSHEPVHSGASSIVDSIQTSDNTSNLIKHSEIDNSMTAPSDEINNLMETQSKADNDDIVPAVIDQQDTHTESEELKCQPKKMKLLRATNQTTCPSPSEPECTETQHDIQTIDTELHREDVQVPGVTDTVNGVDDTEDKNIEHFEHNQVELASPVQDKDQIDKIIDTLQADDETTEKLPIKSECIDELKESIDTKVNGQEKPDSALSDSDEDSHLSVRKDFKTYSRSEGFKAIERRGHFRNPSVGSVSDDVIGSDIEYEDHIGCDDIENNVSDMDEKENCQLPEDFLETVPDVSDKASDILSFDIKTDKHVISSPHWKKSKLNNLNSVGKNTKEAVKKCNGSHKKGKNGIKTNVNVVPMNGSLDDDIDMEVPSPNGDVDGVGIETRGGTMFLTQAHRFLHRSRKTPLKYTDTSFLQGEFMFDDEDDNDYTLKPKISKKSNSVDFNHNTNKSDKGSKWTKSGDKTKDTNLTNGRSGEHLVQLSRTNIQKKKNHNAKSKTLKNNAANTEQKVELNKNGIYDLKNSDTEFSEKPTEGNESDLVSRKRGNKVKSNVQQKTTRSSGVSDTSCKSNKKGKTPVEIQAESAPHTSCSLKTKIDVKPAVHPKSKPLNGLQNMKETRDKTKNCNFDNKNRLEETHSKPKKHISSTFIPEGSDSDDDSDIMLISDEDETSVPHDKVSHIKKEPTPSVDKKLSKLVCDANRESDSEDDVCHKPVKREHEAIAKQGKEESKRKSKTKSQKKRLSKDSQKSHKKFIFESDEEFDPNSISLKTMLNKTQHLLKKNQKSKKQDSTVDFKGPLVRIEGKKEAPEKCVVINERLETTSSGKAKALPPSVATRIQISHLPSDKSVLVPQANAEEENQWLCALCGKHSSYRFLGDLFGPYTVDNSLDADPGHINVKPVSKKRKSDESVHGANKPSRTSRRVGGVSRESDSMQEVWVHESCSVWSDGVYLIGSKIYGLQEAISVAHQTPCTHCLEMGAMIGCLNKGCKEKYHYSCALQIDCYMDEENFSLLCPKHKVKKLKPPAPSTSSSVT